MPGTDTPSQPTGRFAPSPTGDLHFGSLIAAVASYLQAKHRGGRWLIRVDDLDPPREVPGSASRILEDLAAFDLMADDAVFYQSRRAAAYSAAVDYLLEKDLAYWCGCTRAELPRSGVYPGTCSRGLPSGKQPRSVRLRVPAGPIRFNDLIQGPVTDTLSLSVGDFVIRRADGFAAYQLATVVDDAYQQVSEVVRGADLLKSTARQICLQRLLGLPTPVYAHHPVAMGADQTKLSKRLRSDPLARHPPTEALARALEFLGQRPPLGMSLEGTWNWALANWDLSRVPRSRPEAVECIPTTV